MITPCKSQHDNCRLLLPCRWRRRYDEDKVSTQKLIDNCQMLAAEAEGWREVKGEE